MKLLKDVPFIEIFFNIYVLVDYITQEYYISSRSNSR